MREARVALAAGLVLIAVALAAVLLHSPAAVAGSNGVAAEDPLGQILTRSRVCQSGEALPAGTSALVVSLSAFHGPAVSAEALSGASVLTRGRQGSNWSGRTVTIPLRPLARAVRDATICLAFSPGHEAVVPFGQPASPTLAAGVGGSPLPGRMRAEYLKAGDRSWWSLASAVAYHVGLGRAAGGAWAAILAIALGVAVTAAAAGALAAELR
ncbi:MAG TPA: hypothetical protein VMF09_01185 [Solirubrobacteraceae bacterium]|nr:hypothetical protein [Solirubrobacteraceae bacterium]